MAKVMDSMSTNNGLAFGSHITDMMSEDCYQPTFTLLLDSKRSPIFTTHFPKTSVSKGLLVRCVLLLFFKPIIIAVSLVELGRGIAVPPFDCLMRLSFKIVSLSLGFKFSGSDAVRSIPYSLSSSEHRTHMGFNWNQKIFPQMVHCRSRSCCIAALHQLHCT